MLSLTAAELQVVLSAADPAAVLLPGRLMRRIIRRECQLPGLGLHVPHLNSFVVGRETLRSLIRPEESPASYRSHMPKTILLLMQPEAESLASTPREIVLVHHWRMLFHARIEAALEPTKAPQLTRAAVRSRIAQIGQAAFDEIRAVLRDESRLLPPADDRSTYCEFVASYLELRRFAPNLLQEYFPSLDDCRRIDAIVAADVEADEVFRRTRLAGAPDPSTLTPYAQAAAQKKSDVIPPVDWASGPLASKPANALRCASHERSAQRAEQRGNDVKAAVEYALASCHARTADAVAVRGQAMAALGRLGDRIRATLELDSPSAAMLQKLLPCLLAAAASGFWSQAARLLYDLQRACVDHERPVQAVSLWRWLRSFGRSPLRRHMPHVRRVLIARRLRSAANRLQHVDVAPAAREELDNLLHSADALLQNRLRNEFRPVIATTLTETGFVPRNAPERVAFDKLVEELLDRIAANGRFSLGHLRDAISHNQLKLPDLCGVGEFVAGDSLLRADRRLSKSLDGVYRRGEFFLRWLQRLSSLASGTRLGRLVTLHLVLPFGGALLILEGLQHTVFVPVVLITHAHLNLANRYSLTIVAAVIYACLHVPGFGKRLWSIVSTGVQKGWTALVGLVGTLIQLPSLQRILHSRAFEVVRRFVLYPSMIVVFLLHFVPIAFRVYTHDFFSLEEDYTPPWPERPIVVVALTYLAVCAAINAPFGQRIEGMLFEKMLGAWNQLRFNLLPGLLRVVIEAFAWLLESLERLLYTIDQWICFREGQSRIALVAIAVGGAAWGLFEYFIRVFVNLIVEPQVNPIKHFPVVTVSHKIMLPMAKQVKDALATLMGESAALTTTTAVLFSLPGVCGFLTWELMSNWQLYAANRPKDLSPTRIGSHGETMLRFMRPGFHSGTLPKLFAKLRRVEGELRGGDPKKAAALREKLHHVGDSIREFTLREFSRALAECSAWKGSPLAVGHVHLAAKRVRIELTAPFEGNAATVVFEEQSGLLVASVESLGWIETLSAERRRAFRFALGGYYKLAGVDVCREQLATCFPPLPAGASYWLHDISDEGLVIWPDAGFDAAAIYPIHEDAVEFHASCEAGFPCPPEPLAAERVLFKRTTIGWNSWVRGWEYMDDGGYPQPLLNIRLFSDERVDLFQPAGSGQPA